MDYIALFLIVILATTKTTKLHHHCNSDVFSSASGLQELTTLQYCLIDNRARTNVVTFECSFVLVTFVSRFYATKHSLNLIMHKISSNFK